MKKILLLLALVSVQFVFSQTAAERKKIMEIYENSKSERIPFDHETYPLNEKEKAVALANQKGIPTQIIKDGVVVGDLVRFENDMPIYYGIDNAGSAITTRANLVQPGGSMGLSLSGIDMTVGVWDQNNPRTDHLDFSSRVLIYDASITANSNHSTHVTGTMISNGQSAANGRGIAYDANCWANDWNNDIAEMQATAQLGLILSNHSYGSIATSLSQWQFGAYVSSSSAVDNVCFNNPKYLPVYAAGNDRDSFSSLNATKNGFDLLNGTKIAKNAMVVGAVNEVPNYIDPSSVSISTFSSYGPTDDFRIKPDVVAKGVNVFSTTFFSTTSYGNLSGTSMAAPGVTSSLLLVQQYFGFPFLNAATLKGLAIHTADDAGIPGPDPSYGWGLLNTAKMVQTLIDNNTSSRIIESTLSNNGQFFIDVLASGPEAIKATLSWTDRPGTLATTGTIDQSTARLVNDLDLRITNTNTTFFPYYLNKNWSNLVPMLGDNNVDNVENVVVPNSTGIYRVTVSHKGSLVGGSQNYSLVITGIDAQAVLNTNQFNADKTVVWYDKNEVTINIQATKNIKNTEIFDLNGRKLLEKAFNINNAKLELNSFQRGVYVVRVTLDDGEVVAKKVNIFN